MEKIILLFVTKCKIITESHSTHHQELENIFLYFWCLTTLQLDIIKALCILYLLEKFYIVLLEIFKIK